ncbi:MAG: hypothetical protein A2Y64_02190 [Candidatus Coatesbacteria bacterium RBG_13_66_14]|uniref:HEPN domain-containing protein n=1 Tax=Candidatus Coatesbacteria bacterium RBG_13_66_14 TaxID=1817816 RepID=A0A1F5FGM4_9BACT|nr:MAG: hypothetical protein A2Y64_02190 [Candidatus Coatesbacteria bacterium RBG_13_66_14]
MNWLDWVSANQLKAEPSAPREIADLLAVVERNLVDSSVIGLSQEWCFNISYSAALLAALTLLRAEGYRPPHQAHHYLVIQSLRYTINYPPALIAQFERFRRKRNQTTYDCVGTVSQKDVEAMSSQARDLLQRVRDWLMRHHPELL